MTCGLARPAAEHMLVPVLPFFFFSWDDTKSLWSFHKGFPDGFTPVSAEGGACSLCSLVCRCRTISSHRHMQPITLLTHVPCNTTSACCHLLAAAANRFDSGIGVWVSPWGGYGSAKQERCAAIAFFCGVANLSKQQAAMNTHTQRHRHRDTDRERETHTHTHTQTHRHTHTLCPPPQCTAFCVYVLSPCVQHCVWSASRVRDEPGRLLAVWPTLLPAVFRDCAGDGDQVWR